VIFNEEDEDGRERVTEDEERVLIQISIFGDSQVELQQ